MAHRSHHPKPKFWDKNQGNVNLKSWFKPIFLLEALLLLHKIIIIIMITMMMITIIMIIIIIIIMTLASYLSWSVDIMVTYVIEFMKGSESKQLACHMFEWCIAMAPNLPLVTVFAVQSLEQGSSWENGYVRQQFMNPSKNLGWRGWGGYCFLT